MNPLELTNHGINASNLEAVFRKKTNNATESALTKFRNLIHNDTTLGTSEDLKLHHIDPEVKTPLQINVERNVEAESLPFPFTNFVLKPSSSCSKDKQTAYVIMVKSATANSDRRTAIRETFGQKNLFSSIEYSLVFLLGTSADFVTTQNIREEVSQYDDIIQGDFVDTYHNLTLKGIMGLRWFRDFCPQAKVLINIDDDVFLNMFAVLTFIVPRFNGKSRMIGCSMRKRNTSAINREDGKWKVDDSEFPGLKTYPFDYCNGYFVVLSADLATKLIHAVNQTKFFWIDDIYLYGMLPHTAGDVTFIQLSSRTTLLYNEGKECIQSHGASCRYVALSKFHDNFSVGHFYLVWARMLTALTEHVRARYKLPDIDKLKKTLLDIKDSRINSLVRQGLRPVKTNKNINIYQ